ncbi:MAG: DUF58 domain-containing protein [Patescibacteria group bacterium]
MKKENKKTRRIEPLVAKYINDFRIGSHRSLRRGWGGDFDAVQPWQAGDRRVHMPATARTGEVQAKVFQEPKQLSIWVLVDVSRSMSFGAEMAKNEATVVLLACLEMSANKVGDLLGLMVFTDNIIRINQPAQNAAVAKEMAKLIFDCEIPVAETSLLLPLERLIYTGVNHSLVVIISDFFFSLGEKEMGLMRQLSASPGVVVLSLVLCDHQEASHPLHGFLADTHDAENDRSLTWDLSSGALAKAEAKQFDQWQKDIAIQLRQANSECVFLDISDNFVRRLARYFVKKQQYAV